MSENVKVRPGTERWRQLVMMGIVKDGERNWFLGDAALEIAPARWEQMNDGTMTPAFYPGEEALLVMHRYADEIGVDHNRLAIYRQTAAYWPKEKRVAGTSWKVHQMLVRQQDLIEQRMTVTQAHEALGHSTAGRGGALAEQRRAEVAPVPQDVQERRDARHAVLNHIDERERRNDLAPRVEWVASLLSSIRKEVADTPLHTVHRQRIHNACMQVAVELTKLVETNGLGEIEVMPKEARVS